MPSPSAKLRTLSIGGATFDLFVGVGAEAVEHNGVHALHLPLGAKMRVKSVLSACGGGACNTAVSLARLGCDACFAGMLGDDQWGEFLQNVLKKEGVRTDMATVVDKEPSSFSIILSAKNGERVIMYEPGVNVHMHDATFDKAAAAGMDWIYLNHLHDKACIIEDDVVEILEKNPKIGLTWNPGGSQLKAGIAAPNCRALAAQSSFMQLNKEEALAFTGQKTVKQAIAVLLEIGAKVVCVTDGKRGMLASDGKTLYTCVPPEAKIVDTTGAGDAFGSACTWALATGLDLPTALKAGTIQATSVIGAIGAQAGLLTHTDILRRMKETALSVTEEPAS